MNYFARRKHELVVCYAPLLFCVLLAELLMKISVVSLQHQNRCRATADIYMELGDDIEDCIKEEEQLKYYLT
jgi:hypothetical protein